MIWFNIIVVLTLLYLVFRDKLSSGKYNRVFDYLRLKSKEFFSKKYKKKKKKRTNFVGDTLVDITKPLDDILRDEAKVDRFYEEETSRPEERKERKVESDRIERDDTRVHTKEKPEERKERKVESDRIERDDAREHKDDKREERKERKVESDRIERDDTREHKGKDGDVIMYKKFVETNTKVMISFINVLNKTLEGYYDDDKEVTLGKIEDSIKLLDTIVEEDSTIDEGNKRKMLKVLSAMKRRMELKLKNNIYRGE